jgi:hypothetical protein
MQLEDHGMPAGKYLKLSQYSSGVHNGDFYSHLRKNEQKFQNHKRQTIELKSKIIQSYLLQCETNL